MNLPEFILNEEEAPECTQSGFSYSSQHYYPLFPADGAALQEEPATVQSVQPFPQTSQRVGQFYPSESHLFMDESLLQGASTAAERSWTINYSDQGAHTLSWTQTDLNQHYWQPVSQSLAIEPQIQTQDSCLLPTFQDLSQFALPQPVLRPLLPELVCAPRPPPDYCCLNTAPVASMLNSRSNCGPGVLDPVNNPTEFLRSSYRSHQSLFLLPNVNPSWCLCPQAVTVHQPCGPHQVLRGAAQQVSEQINVTSESEREQSEEQAEPEEEQQKNDTPVKDKLQENYTDDGGTQTKASPGSPASLDEESLAERAFEEYMIIMDSLSPKIREGPKDKEKENEEDEDEEKEKLKTENQSLLEYLDEQCSDEDFIRNVESMLDIEFLNALFSADPKSVDHLALETLEQEDGLKLNTANLDSLPSSHSAPHLPPTRELQRESLNVILQQRLHPPSADSNSEAPVAGETSQAASHVETPLQRAQSDTQSDKQPDQDGHDALLSTNHIESKEGSPLLSSVLEEPQQTDATASSNPVNPTCPLHHDGSASLDQSFDSFLQLLTGIFSPDTSLEQKAKGNDAPAEKPAASVPAEDVSEKASKSFSNPADTHPAQTHQKLQEGPLPEDPPTAASSSSSSVSGSTEDHHTTSMDDPVHSSSCLPVSSMSSGLQDNAAPVSGIPSSMTDSPAESCAPKTDGNLSDSVSEKQTAETPKGLQASQEFQSSGEQVGPDRKCEKNLVEETEKQTAITATAGERSKKTFEREEQSKENENKVKRTTNKVKSRRSQRLLGQFEKEKVRLLSGGAEQISETSFKITEKFTHERDEVTSEQKRRRFSKGRQLSKEEESRFKERRKETEAVNTAEQLLQIREIEQHQKERMEELKVEEGEQCEVNNTSLSTETGVENDLSTKMTQEEKESSEEGVKTKERGTETSSFVRRTRSTTSQEAREKIQRSEVQNKSEIKSSPERETHEDEQPSQVSGKDEVSGVSPPEPSQQSPGGQTDTHPTEDSIKDVKGGQESCEGALKEINESDFTSAASPETQQPCKAVRVTENLDFYNLRSRFHKPNTPKGTILENKAAEAALHPSNPKNSQDQSAAERGDDERMNEEEAERPSFTSSPVKRNWHEEKEAKANNETETIAPTKRGRWRRLKVNSERETEQKLRREETEEDEVETSGRTPSPPLTRGQRKTKHKKILKSSSAGPETAEGHRSRETKTRVGCKKTHIPHLPHTRQTRSSKKIPTKYRDFVLCKTNRLRQQTHKERETAGKGEMLRGGRKRTK